MNAFDRFRKFTGRVDLAYELWAWWGMDWRDAWRVAGREA